VDHQNWASLQPGVFGFPYRLFSRGHGETRDLFCHLLVAALRANRQASVVTRLDKKLKTTRHFGQAYS